MIPVGRFGVDAGSGATGVLAKTRREAAESAVTVRLPHAVRPTLSSASADAPASGSCCPPSIKCEQIESLHELGFVDRRENVILLGALPHR